MCRAARRPFDCRSSRGDMLSQAGLGLQGICNLSRSQALLPSRCSSAGIFLSGRVQLDIFDDACRTTRCVRCLPRETRSSSMSEKQLTVAFTAALGAEGPTVIAIPVARHLRPLVPEAD